MLRMSLFVQLLPLKGGDTACVNPFRSYFATAGFFIPLKSGARFSTNAVNASLASAERTREANSSFSTLIA
jgi:hypothetical protein